MAGPEGLVTQIMQRVRDGDSRAAAELLPLVYAELRRIAAAMMARLPSGQTLQPTALVHEAYLRLVGDADPGWNSRGHFFAAAAQAMRQLLVEQARRRASLKRGGDRKRVELHDVEATIAAPSTQMLALDQALERLERAQPRKASVIMLHCFAGLTLPETAAALSLSVPTVERDWRFCKALLRAQLEDAEA